LGFRALGRALIGACSLASIACGEDERTRILDPVQVAMDESVEPTYSDDEMVVYESKRGVAFPIIAPSDDTMASLNGRPMDPYGRTPWLTLDDVRVQLSWTLTNLDDEQHVIELIVDPWNEFGRYYPGLTLIDAEEGEYAQNLSGIDTLFVLEPVSKGNGSRRQGTLTYEDLDEMARDFGTVMSLIQNPPTTNLGGQPLEEGESVLPTYVNHVFETQNRSDHDPLIRDWIPSTIAGLTGIDVGLRSIQGGAGPNGELPPRPRVALEVVVEITDQGTNKVRREGEKDALLPPTDVIVTIGTQ
jgi:hypothetical protein